MKNAVKYIVLSISSVICFVLLFIMAALLLDIGSLSYPATLILPMISAAVFISGFVMLTIWAFKFSNNKDHKNYLIISLSVFLLSVGVFVAARIVNPIISEGNTEEEQTTYFDFTVTEFVDVLGDEYFTHLTYIDTVTLDDGSTVNSYTFGSPSDSYAPMVHYSITYDKQTEKVSRVWLTIDKDFETDTSDSGLVHYLIHVDAVSRTIESDIDTDSLMGEIVQGFTEEELKFAICNREKFMLHATEFDTFYTASFYTADNKFTLKE